MPLGTGSSPTGVAEGGLDPRHKPWLDGWRGIAILAVLLGHLIPADAFRTARFGVELFFVLSGRLMAELLFVKQQPLGYFLRRRVARVWPALYAYVLIMAVIFSAAGPNHIDGHQIAGALTYTFNYVRIMSGPVLPLDHLWSLCVEEWSYLFLAGLALAVRKWSFRASVAILLIAALSALNGVIQTSLGLTYRDVYWRTDVRIASIFMSCGLYLILRNRAVPSYLPIVAGLVGSALQAGVFPDTVKYTIGTMCLAISIATIDSAPRLAIRALASKPLTQAGLWSYSIYLWQQPFTKLLHDLPIAVNLALILAAALTSFYFIEQPARRYLGGAWADRSLKKRADQSLIGPTGVPEQL